MAIEIMHGKDYLSVTNSLDKTHKLVIEENGKQLLYSIEFMNEHNTYFDDEDKRLIEKILQTGTKQQLAELLNLQFICDADSLERILLILRGREKVANRR